MKYYIVKDSLNEKIVGSDYPQVYKFIKGYDERAPHALFSLYEYDNSFPDYIPELDGLMLAGYAKLTDFVSCGFGPDLYIVSPKVKGIFDQFHLCPHRFYPLGLYKRKVKHDYYLLHIIPSDYIDYVDFKKTSFVDHDFVYDKIFGDISVESKDELFKKRDEIERIGGICRSVWGKQIVMNSFFDKEVDFFEISWIDSNTYVSERLKNAIEQHGLTGWEFIPANNLLVE